MLTAPDLRPSSLDSSLRSYEGYMVCERGLSPATVQDYLRSLRELLASLNGGATITTHDVRHYIVLLSRRGLCAKGIGGHVAAVRGFCRFLKETGVQQTDPVDAVELPKCGRPLPKIIGEREIEALIAAARAEPPVRQGRASLRLAIRDVAMLELLYGVGCRASELTQLRLSDVNCDARLIRLFGKGSKERIVPFGRPAEAAVRSYLADLRPSLVVTGPNAQRFFLSRFGRTLDRHDVYKIVRRCARLAGLNHHVSPHVLRHACATHMLDHGANLRTVQEMLGHVDVATTEIYTHVSIERLRAVHRRCLPWAYGEATGSGAASPADPAPSRTSEADRR